MMDYHVRLALHPTLHLLMEDHVLQTRTSVLQMRYHHMMEHARVALRTHVLKMVEELVDQICVR